MKNLFTRLRTRGASLKTAVVTLAMVGAASANAALPAWATSMVSDASDNVTSIFALVGPVVGIAIAGGLVIKLVKRGTSKI